MGVVSERWRESHYRVYGSQFERKVAENYYSRAREGRWTDGAADYNRYARGASSSVFVDPNGYNIILLYIIRLNK